MRAVQRQTPFQTLRASVHVRPQHFLSVHLLRGTLEAELGYAGADGRRVAVAAAEGGSFVDGSKHSVIVNVSGK